MTVCPFVGGGGGGRLWLDGCLGIEPRVVRSRRPKPFRLNDGRVEGSHFSHKSLKCIFYSPKSGSTASLSFGGTK